MSETCYYWREIFLEKGMTEDKILLLLYFLWNDVKDKDIPKDVIECDRINMEKFIGKQTRLKLVLT